MIYINVIVQCICYITVHCICYITVHCICYITVHCIFYITVHCIFYITAHCIFYITVNCIFYSVQWHAHTVLFNNEYNHTFPKPLQVITKVVPKLATRLGLLLIKINTRRKIRTGSISLNECRLLTRNSIPEHRCG